MLALRLNAGLGRLLTARVYGRQLAVQAWERNNADFPRRPGTGDATGGVEALAHCVFQGGAEGTDGAPAAEGRTARLGLDGEAIGSGERQSVKTLAGWHLHLA